MDRKPLLSAQRVAHACTLLEQGERTVKVVQLLNVSRRTLERALRNAASVSAEGNGHFGIASGGRRVHGNGDAFKV